MFTDNNFVVNFLFHSFLANSFFLSNETISGSISSKNHNKNTCFEKVVCEERYPSIQKLADEFNGFFKKGLKHDFVFC